MATIKSYTSLEQSRKLAEILPLETADMYYEPSAGFRTELSEAKIGDIEYAHPRSIRCWSLAALLSVLPKIINNETLFIETSAALWHIGYRKAIIYTVGAALAIYEIVKAPLVKDDIKEWEE